MSLVAKSLFDLRDSDLTGQAQIFAVRAFLACRELGHRRDSLPAGIACPNAIALHIPMVARRETR
jgi:hypothetical protein